MFDERTLAVSKAAADKRAAEYAKIVERFGDKAPAQAREPLRIRACR